MIWYFICDGDVQYKQHDDGRIAPLTADKDDKVNKIIELHKEHPELNLVIHAGDLLDKGNDTKSFEKFKSEYVHTIEKDDLKLLMCAGNHDTYVSFPYLCKPVFKYLKKKYDTTFAPFCWKYSGCYKRIHNGINFISMGVYPKNLRWLKNNLPSKEEPVIIFYHYNTADNPFSDWWSASEKEKFYDVIKDHNILMLHNGHWHHSGITEWKEIKEVHGSGGTVALIKMEGTKISEITFH